MIREQCHVCGNAPLIEWDGFERLHRVTSDSRPWPVGGRLGYCDRCGSIQKPVNDAWRQEMVELYAGYQLYYQSNIYDQLVFDSTGTAKPKYEWVAARLAEFHSASGKPGAILDVGCGRGAFLAAISKYFHGWALTGCDLREENRAEIEQLGRFHCGPVQEVSGTYDLVSLSHVLEHVPNPLPFLIAAAARMNIGGKLFIQVPNVRENPYDLLVADHCTHFSPQSLAALAAAAGLSVEVIAVDWVGKEISMLCGRGNSGLADLDSPDEVAAAAALIADWRHRLSSTISGASAAISQSDSRRVGLFGTAIAVVWLDNQLGHKFDFFLDEDPGRVDKQFHGRPVYSPPKAPGPAIVYIPMAAGVSRVIAERCKRDDLEFIWIDS